MFLIKTSVRIVATIPGSTTVGGNTYIDENGNRWREITQAECNYLRGNGATCPAVIKTVRNGEVC